MNARNIEEADLDSIVAIYYKIENKTPSATLEGWALSELREQLSDFLSDKNYICLCDEAHSKMASFVFCRVASMHLATIEIFCKDPDLDPHCQGANSVFAALIQELRRRGIQTANTLVNKKHHNFRLHTKFLEFVGFNKTSEFAEYEMDVL
jgi:L-amino acid N-acyltransferase YncA